MSTLVLVTEILCSVAVIRCDYMVNVYPEFLKIGDVTTFDPNRWMTKNGLDKPSWIPPVKQTGAIAGRWVQTDLLNDLFEKAPEDPQRKGYPDPAYFRSQQQQMVVDYLNNVKQYNNTEMVADIFGLNWPHWMDTSPIRKGLFPNNINAAAEFVFLLIQAIVEGSQSKYPLFFEGMNEPDGKFQYGNWSTIVTFYQAFAEKVKPKYPNVRLGGPTCTGGIIYFDHNNFTLWKQVEKFLDMALTHLDFFSFHTYAYMNVSKEGHLFHHDSEAKLFGLLDMIESYALKTRGRSINFSVSEYGLSNFTGMESNKSSTFLDWGYIYQHNYHLFTFLERRDIMKKAIAFLMTYATFEGQWSINFSILDKNQHERDIAQAFKFWKNMNNTMNFLRVDSQFHGAERKIIPHVLVDKTTGSLIILLHNSDKHPNDVKLSFEKGWFHPGFGNSTCEYLGPQNMAVLEVNKPVNVTNSVVTIPAEASCSFQFHTAHDFTEAQTVTQKTYYSTNMIIAIHSVVDINVNIATLGNVEFARLRIGVSFTDKYADPQPKTVQLNGHPLTSFYSLHTQNIPSDDTWWQTYEYNIPANALLLQNDVKLSFAQSGGYVCTVAIVVGRH